ncbi:hypothetical protein L4D04_21765 [Photobacterium angustum]|uniref:Uncharacterized protein n=1 Tax=Photobacterium angustum (strain S14 / CCUG 15956) TaxID=314292 RepID=Q1ZKF8_PHOAS|nr:hypothetical protein [Photobacterium angustum]EAS62651.1 hypothetical protein VAS14_18679 [Photobacterium angustum S14]
MKIKMKFFILVIVAIYSCKVFSAKLELLPITYDSHNSSFILSEFVEDTTDGRLLKLADIKSPRTAEQVLAKYYWLLKNGNTDKASSLYYIDDGSQEKFIKAIKSKNLKLEGFKNLSEVKINHIQRWSSFVYLWVTFISDTGQEFSLKEKVNCTSECKIVFTRFLEKNEIDELLELNLFTYKTLEGKIYRSLSQSDLIDFTKVTVNHPKDLGGVNKTYPMSFYLNFDKTYREKIVSRKDDCNITYKSNVELAMCVFLNKFESINVLESEKLAKFISEVRGGSYREAIVVMRYSGKHIEKQFYQPKPFIQWVNSWSSMKLLGSLENESTYFLFFKPKFESGREGPIQVVTFDKINDPNYSTAIYGNNGEDTYLYFQNEVFLTELSNIIGE